MSEAQKTLLRKNRVEIMKTLILNETFLSYFYPDHVLTDDMCEEINVRMIPVVSSQKQGFSHVVLGPLVAMTANTVVQRHSQMTQCWIGKCCFCIDFADFPIRKLVISIEKSRFYRCSTVPLQDRIVYGIIRKVHNFNLTLLP